MEVITMLVLTRHVGQTIYIGDDITVTILGLHGKQIRVGVNAPKSISVHREEIYRLIQDEKDNCSSKKAQTEAFVI